MTPFWKKTLALGLSLAGLLMTAPLVSAHGPQNEHGRIHRELRELHEDFHQTPHSRREHRRFHKQLKREHRAADRDLRWRRYDDRYDYGSTYSDRYRYGRRPYYGDSSRYGW